jgi:hypothetical protein
MSDVRITSLNVGHQTWARPVPPSVVATLLDLEPDVLVLVEYVEGDGRPELCEALGDAGLQHIATSAQVQRMGRSWWNQVLIANGCGFLCVESGGLAMTAARVPSLRSRAGPRGADGSHGIVSHSNPRGKLMPKFWRLVAFLIVTMLLSACPMNRGGGGGGGGGGDDDDTATAAEPGLFIYYFEDYYSDGDYYQARLLLPLEEGFDCDEVDGLYLEDTDNNFISAYLYRGVNQDWEGTFSEYYGADCTMSDYDYDDAKCFLMSGVIDGNEEYGDNDDSFRIDDFSSSGVEGQLVLSDVTYDFAVSNCGEWSYGERGPGPTASDRERSRTPRATTSRQEPSWRLRFR